MVEYKVCLQGDDSKEYVISYADLRRKLNIDDRIDFILKRLLALEDEFVDSLELKAEQEILNLIKKNPNIRTGELTDYFTVANHFMHLAFWHAWDKLKESGRIIATSHGQGHHRTWKIKEV